MTACAHESDWGRGAAVRKQLRKAECVHCNYQTDRINATEWSQQQQGTPNKSPNNNPMPLRTVVADTYFSYDSHYVCNENSDISFFSPSSFLLVLLYGKQFFSALSSIIPIQNETKKKEVLLTKCTAPLFETKHVTKIILKDAIIITFRFTRSKKAIWILRVRFICVVLSYSWRARARPRALESHGEVRRKRDGRSKSDALEGKESKAIKRIWDNNISREKVIGK